jgi:uncharacterized protein (DUF433 family)
LVWAEPDAIRFDKDQQSMVLGAKQPLRPRIETTLRGTFTARNHEPWRQIVKFTRITFDTRQMDGVPCIRGLRIPVATVVGMIADRMTEAEILSAYPDLERADIQEALRYAAQAVRERALPLIAS